jgi:hypothetical protein
MNYIKLTRPGIRAMNAKMGHCLPLGYWIIHLVHGYGWKMYLSRFKPSVWRPSIRLSVWGENYVEQVLCPRLPDEETRHVDILAELTNLLWGFETEKPCHILCMKWQNRKRGISTWSFYGYEFKTSLLDYIWKYGKGKNKEINIK